MSTPVIHTVHNAAICLWLRLIIFARLKRMSEPGFERFPGLMGIRN